MMLVTLRGVRRLPPVRIWNKITMAISAMKRPIWRSLLTRKAPMPPPVAVRGGSTGACGSTTSETGAVIDLILFLGHVLHEHFLVGFADRHFAGDPARRHRVDAIACSQQLGQLAGDDEDRFALGGQPIDDRVDLVLSPDVDAPCGLVEDQ